MEAILTPPPKVAKHNLMEGPGPSPAPEELKLNFSNFNVKVAPVKETNKQDQATMTTQKRQDINLPGTNETKEALDSISTKWDSEKVYDPMFNLLIEVEQDFRSTTNNEVIPTGKATITGDISTILSLWSDPRNLLASSNQFDMFAQLDTDNLKSLRFFYPGHFQYVILVKNASSPAIDKILKAAKGNRINGWELWPAWFSIIGKALNTQNRPAADRIFTGGVTASYHRGEIRCHMHIGFGSKAGMMATVDNFLDPNFEDFSAAPYSICHPNGDCPWLSKICICKNPACDGEDCSRFTIAKKYRDCGMLLIRHVQSDPSREAKHFTTSDFHKACIIAKNFGNNIKVRTQGADFDSYNPETNMLIFTGLEHFGKDLLKVTEKICQHLYQDLYLDPLTVAMEQLPVDTLVCDICAIWGKHRTIDCKEKGAPLWTGHTHRELYFLVTPSKMCIKSKCSVASGCTDFHKYKIVEMIDGQGTWVPQLSRELKQAKQGPNADYEASPQPQEWLQASFVNTNHKHGTRKWDYSKDTAYTHSFLIQKCDAPDPTDPAVFGGGKTIPASAIMDRFPRYPGPNSIIRSTFSFSTLLKVSGGNTVCANFFDQVDTSSPFPFLDIVIGGTDMGGNNNAGVKAHFLRTKVFSLESILKGMGVTSKSAMLKEMTDYSLETKEKIAEILPYNEGNLVDVFASMESCNAIVMAAALTRTKIIFLVFNKITNKSRVTSAKFHIMISGNSETTKTLIILVRKEGCKNVNDTAVAMTPLVLAKGGEAITLSNATITYGQDKDKDDAIKKITDYVQHQEGSSKSRLIKNWEILSSGTNSTSLGAASESSGASSTSSATSVEGAEGKDPSLPPKEVIQMDLDEQEFEEVVIPTEGTPPIIGGSASRDTGASTASSASSASSTSSTSSASSTTSKNNKNKKRKIRRAAEKLALSAVTTTTKKVHLNLVGATSSPPLTLPHTTGRPLKAPPHPDAKPARPDHRNMLKTIYPSQDHHNMSGNGTARINRCLNYTSISHGYNINFTCKRSTVINMFFNKPMATHKESLLQLKFEFTDLNPNIILMTTKHHLTSTESEEAQTPV
jgi:hypothetical protein